MSFHFPIIFLHISMNESLCSTLIQQRNLYSCVNLLPLSPSVCGFYYFTLENIGFQSRLVFHRWIWDPGITGFDFMNGGVEYFEDPYYLREDQMKFYFSGIHGEDISGLLSFGYSKSS